MLEIVKQQLAPTGTLRAGINMSNFLLVSTTSNNSPDGVSPAIARNIADKLGVQLQLIPYKGAGEVADAAINDEWDIANIGAEPERAKTISFSPAYCEIQATYLLPKDSPIQTMADIDKPGIRIAVKNRAAYDLYLTQHLKHAELIRADSLDASFEIFEQQQLDVLAGLRPKLLEQQQLMAGSRLMDDAFTAVQQSIGCQKNKPEATAFLKAFVEDAIQTELVARLIEKFEQQGKLSVA